jgi:hypothetical protein
MTRAVTPYADRCIQPPVTVPVVDLLQCVVERLAMTARSPSMDDPTFTRVLNEVRVEGNEQLRKGERMPAAIDIDLHCCLQLFVAFNSRCW